MTSEWREVRLGEVFEVSNERLGPHEEEPTVFAISKYEGFVKSSDYHDRRVASANLEGYKVVRPNYWAYSTIHIDEGSIARNSHGELGVVSPMYTILRWIGVDHSPEYFELLLRSAQMLAIYGDMAQGSINRRRSLPWKTFDSIEVSVPSLPEQRRIVDLIAALDDAIEAAEEHTSALTASATALRQHTFVDLAHAVSPTPAGDFFEVTLGRQKSARQLHGDHEIPYIRAANIGIGRMIVSDVQQMNFDLKEQQKYCLQQGDVLVVEGGSIGQTAVWNGEIDGPVGFDKHVLRLRGRDGRSTSFYANQWSQWCYESGSYAAAARGITIKALGHQRASSMPVPDISLEHQAAVASLLGSPDQAASSARSTTEALTTLRSELLGALLSGAHRIPESYDELLPV